MATQNSINLKDPGIVSYDGAGIFAGRTITAGTGVSISNGDGISGNPTISASGSVPITFTTDSGNASPLLGVINVLGGTGVDTTGASNTVTINVDVTELTSIPTSFTADSGSATPAANNLNVVTLANDGIVTSAAGSTVTITSANDLAAVEALATTGYAVRTGASTWATRTFQEGTGIDLTNADGTIGNTTIAVDVTEITNIATTYNADSGSASPSANALSIVTLANDGIVTSGAGSTITITSANDLAAVEALATTGYAVRTGASTWATRTFQEGTGIDLTNADGVSGNTTIAFDVTEVTTIPTTFLADTGSATPASNQITFAGGSGIATSASGSTVTITASGGGGGNWVPILCQTASASASIDFTDLDSTYHAYVVVITDVLPATDERTLNIRTSSNNGVSFDAGASDYRWKMVTGLADVNADAREDQADSQIRMMSDQTAGGGPYPQGNGVNEQGSFTVWIYDPSNTKYTKVFSQGTYFRSDGDIEYVCVGGVRQSTTAVNAIRFLYASGNIAQGEFCLYGLEDA